MFDLDFLGLTFLGDPSDSFDRLVGSDHGPVGSYALPLVNSRPFRAFVIENISPIARGLGDMSPGIGGWFGASMMD
jgi:hypothetical protein